MIQPVAQCDENLAPHQVDPCQFLGHCVLDLNARIDLYEVELARVLIDQEFHGSCVLILNGTADGLLFGNAAQVGIQATAVAAAIVYSAVVSFALLKLIALFVPLRADAADEATGLDLTMHGEEAYVHSAGSAALEPVAAAKPAAVGVLETA